MPISGILLSCQREKIHIIEDAIRSRPHSEVRSVHGGAVAVVTDTESLEEDRQEVEALGALPGVLLSNIVFTNLEDVAEKPPRTAFGFGIREGAVT